MLFDEISSHFVNSQYSKQCKPSTLFRSLNPASFSKFLTKLASSLSVYNLSCQSRFSEEIKLFRFGKFLKAFRITESRTESKVDNDYYNALLVAAPSQLLALKWVLIKCIVWPTEIKRPIDVIVNTGFDKQRYSKFPY